MRPYCSNQRASRRICYFSRDIGLFQRASWFSGCKDIEPRTCSELHAIHGRFSPDQQEHYETLTWKRSHGSCPRPRHLPQLLPIYTRDFKIWSSSDNWPWSQAAIRYYWKPTFDMLGCMLREVKSSIGVIFHNVKVTGMMQPSISLDCRYVFTACINAQGSPAGGEKSEPCPATSHSLQACSLLSSSRLVLHDQIGSVLFTIYVTAMSRTATILTTRSTMYEYAQKTHCYINCAKWRKTNWSV